MFVKQRWYTHTLTYRHTLRGKVSGEEIRFHHLSVLDLDLQHSEVTALLDKVKC